MRERHKALESMPANGDATTVPFVIARLPQDFAPVSGISAMAATGRWPKHCSYSLEREDATPESSSMRPENLWRKAELIEKSFRRSCHSGIVDVEVFRQVEWGRPQNEHRSRRRRVQLT